MHNFHSMIVPDFGRSTDDASAIMTRFGLGVCLQAPVALPSGSSPDAKGNGSVAAQERTQQAVYAW